MGAALAACQSRKRATGSTLVEYKLMVGCSLGMSPLLSASLEESAQYYCANILRCSTKVAHQRSAPRHVKPCIVGGTSGGSKAAIGGVGPKSACYLVYYARNTPTVTFKSSFKSFTSKMIVRAACYRAFCPTLVSVPWGLGQCKGHCTAYLAA